MAVHARNRQIRAHSHVPDDDARSFIIYTGCIVARATVYIRIVVPRARGYVSFIRSLFHARASDVYSTAAASASSASDLELYHAVLSDALLLR